MAELASKSFNFRARVRPAGGSCIVWRGTISAPSVEAAANEVHKMYRERSMRLSGGEPVVDVQIYNLAEGGEKAEQLCSTCGETIPEGRLRAVPNATQCVNCKAISEKERREKGGDKSKKGWTSYTYNPPSSPPKEADVCELGVAINPRPPIGVSFTKFFEEK